MSKNIDISGLVRENIRNLKPYRSARDDFDTGILLDANENAIGSPFANEFELNRYPLPYQEELRSRIAQYRNMDIDQVFVGVGSDEPIDLLIRIFCEPAKDAILITPPTYGMYKVSAGINNVAVQECLLSEDFELRPEAVLETVTDESKIIFLCSPNNPTGNSLNREQIMKVAENFRGIVVIDEAYIDFSQRQSMCGLIDRHPNLVILQTLSKAFGLAGIRLGIALAHPEIIEYLMKIKAPYNVNKLTSAFAIRAFEELHRVAENIAVIKKERERVAAKLSKIPAVEKIFPSDANFLLFRTQQAYELYQKMAREGVIVRYRGNEPHCENCLRVTIGRPEENNAFLNVLKKILPH